MNAKQKIYRTNDLIDDAKRILSGRSITKEQAIKVNKMVQEAAEIQEDLKERFDAVAASILRVIGLKKSRNTIMYCDITDFFRKNNKKVILEVLVDNRAPKKLDSAMWSLGNSIPSEWLDFDDDDELDEAIRKRLKENEYEF